LISSDYIVIAKHIKIYTKKVWMMTRIPLSQPIVTIAQMREAESRAMAAGIAGRVMMQRAGEAVAQWIEQHMPLMPVWVLCGAGNNGGDGFVVAQTLRARGWDVRCACTVAVDALRGDAALAANDFQGEILSWSQVKPSPDCMVVDALFGTGLTRALDAPVVEVVKQLKRLKVPVIAVDIPSGVQGDTGQSLGVAMAATATITFAAKKPAHVLQPAKTLCGEVVVADIGIAAQVDAVRGESVAGGWLENSPLLWRSLIPFARMDAHKYSRGAVLVVGGGIAHTGAARLSAAAAARLCGAVTIACDAQSLPIYAAHVTSTMTEVAEDATQIEALLHGLRRYAVVVGPASGINARTRGATLAALAAGCPTVIDADALSVFSTDEDRQVLIDALKMSGAPVVLTPHEGEFHRLFAHKGSDISMLEDKITRTLKAAQFAGAVVLLKGNDTVIAAPDGRVIINSNAPAYLATAGAGDVLAGVIAGLMAGGMNAFEAAAASAWIHGRAGTIAGLGLIAEELTQMLPLALQELAAR
jgi:hydroxyethylthiazole kinase-like uncharacterized protein yjeF